MPETGFVRQLRHAGLARLALALVGTHIAQYVLFILSWWAIGQSLLQGRPSAGWLVAWGLLLATIVPLRMLATWYQGRLGVIVGTLLKRRLLFGAMRMKPDAVRTHGVGALLDRSMEAESVEEFGMNGGIASALTVLELVLAGVVLAAGAGGGWHVLALFLWLVLTMTIGYQLTSARAHWTDRQISLTGPTKLA